MNLHQLSETALKPKRKRIMPTAKEYTCRIIETVWLTRTTLGVRFKPSRDFSFEPGQFISLLTPAILRPTLHKKEEHVRRAYSFANSVEDAKKNGYELCVKFVPGGLGSEYWASLRPGDEFKIMAPYGDFTYQTPQEGRSVCFICTGSGVAPFRSIVTSKSFQKQHPQDILCLFGVRTVNEILYRGTFESAGVDIVYAVSQPTQPLQTEFHGRITDYLRQLPKDWKWHLTDFYLCGNISMIREAEAILKGGHGVSDSAIYKEAFNLSQPIKKEIQKKAA